ncbi:hypothetical protein [Chromobacterium haemolyticum]|uniref:hypothetical protein n=1 Tax=Chromobacterium TaxID=535 RepID=UPI004057B108
MGSPQPLWYLATHHAGKKIWEPVIETIAIDPSHPLFEASWQHLMFGGDGKRVAHFVAAIGAEHLQKIFRVLMDRKLETNGWFMPEAWEELFKLAPDEATRSVWLEEMALHASKVLDNILEVRQWVPKGYQTEFYKKLNDFIYFLVLRKMDEIFNEDEGDAGDEPGIGSDEDSEILKQGKLMVLEKFMEAMRKLLDQYPPKLLGTYEVIDRKLARFGFVDASFLSELESKRQLLIADRNTPTPHEPEVDSWVW